MTIEFTISQKKSGIYFVNFEENGARRRLTTGVRDPRAAKKIARNIANGCVAASGQDQAAPDPSRGMTMSQLFDVCMRTVWSPRMVKSQATVRSNVKILTGMIGQIPVREMTYSKLEALVADLFALGYSAGTVHRKMCSVSKALNHATKLEDAKGRPLLAGKIPIPAVPTDNFKDRIISKLEEAKIFAAISRREGAEPTRDWKRFGMLMRFLLDTGCRLGEAVNAKATNLEARNDAVFITFQRYTTKNDKPRTLPLTDAVRQSLPYLQMAATNDRIFPFSTGTAWYMWSNIRKDLVESGCDVSDVVLHTMRHTCLTRLAKSGKVRIERISDWAGHSNIQVTIDRYMHLIPEDRLETLDVLNAI